MHVAPAEDMHMDMVDRLSRLLSEIHDQPISFVNQPLFLDNCLHCAEKIDNDVGFFLGDFMKTGVVHLWYDQNMHGRLGIDVVEREGMVVFTHFGRRDRFVDYFAEQTFGLWCSFRMQSKFKAGLVRP